MSKPKKPFYFKEKSDTYHWERRCSKNWYPNKGWKKANKLPASKRDQCNECKAKQTRNRIFHPLAALSLRTALLLWSPESSAG